jgi:3-hydroxybutyryl-CoA dehydrogenase
MKIAAKGSPERLAELGLILSSAGLNYIGLESTKNIDSHEYDLVFDLNFDDDPHSLSDYLKASGSKTFFLLSGVKMQIESAVPRQLWQKVVFINALPGFLGRKSIEYCTLSDSFDASVFSSIGWMDANKTASRVGMVSPRVVFMIINEAYYTLQEGTASRNDIDQGMKLGTAYPLGPFEWCDKVGLKNVYETLSALYDDTHDERYRICSMLKTEYLSLQNK